MGVDAAGRLVQQEAQSMEVSAPIHLATLELLGGRVLHRSHEGPLTGEPDRRLGQLGDAEVHDLDLVGRGDQDVLGLEIAVYRPGLAQEALEEAGGLQEVGMQDLEGNGLARRQRSGRILGHGSVDGSHPPGAELPADAVGAELPFHLRPE
jgi:hypothetical protein